MQGELDTAPDWAQVVASTAQRHHVVARRELLVAGVPRGRIESWLRTGRLHPVHPGVYAVGRPDLSRSGRWMAALLHCGDGAVLQGRSAAALWGLRRSAERRVSVAVPRTSGRRPPAGIAVRRCRSLRDEERTEHDGLAVTTPARTLLDLAGVLSADDLRSAVGRAERERLLDVAAVQAVMSAHPNAAGRVKLRRLLEELGAWSPATRSELEDRFADLVRRHRLPRPVMNTLVEGQLVDAHWPGARVVVELDGYGAHGTRSAFGRDRRRTNDLQLSGHLVLRFTHGDVTGDPSGTAARIRAALAARRG